MIEAMRISGHRGMTADEMIKTAEDRGFEIERDAFRSFVWSQTKKGRFVRSEDNRYKLAEFSDEIEQSASAFDAPHTSSPKGETGAGDPGFRNP